MSKKHKNRLKELAEIDPEKDMPLPERLKVETPTEEPLDEATTSPSPEIEGLKPKQVKVQPEVVEPGYFSTKVERYRR